MRFLPLFLALLLLPSALSAQDEESPQKKPGLAVDAAGGPVVDPTENVIALTKAEARRQDDLRNATNELAKARLDSLKEIGELRAFHAKEIRELESDRLDKIRQVDVLAGSTASDQAQDAIKTLAATTAANAETLRSLVASTAASIATQTTSAMTAVNDRITALEKSVNTGAGRSAVADPAFAELLTEVRLLKSLQQERTGKSAGIESSWGFLTGIAALIVAMIAIGTFFFSRRNGGAKPVYAPPPPGTLLPTTPPDPVPR